MHTLSNGRESQLFGFRFSQEGSEDIFLHAPRPDGPYKMSDTGYEVYCVEHESQTNPTFKGTVVTIMPTGDTHTTMTVFWTREKLASELESIPHLIP